MLSNVLYLVDFWEDSNDEEEACHGHWNLAHDK